MINPSPALAGEGLDTPADRKLNPRWQIRLSAIWLSGSLVVTFLITLSFDVTIIFFGPIFLFASGMTWLVLMFRGLVVAHALRETRTSALTTSLAAFVGLALFLGGLLPADRAGDYGQAFIVLLLNSSRYERIIATPGPPSIHVPREEWGNVGNSGKNRIFAFNYGGFLSTDQDIVYDPTDQPERHAVEILRAASAGCNWLRGHYYKCTLTFG